MEGKLSAGPLVIFLLVLLPVTQAAGTNRPMEPNVGSTDIVEATIIKLNKLAEENDILSADNRFMRRIAWVETEDGTADHTYSDPAYHGGIWRVDRNVFDVTKRMVNDFLHFNLFDDIERLFCIRWSQAIWEDCRKPLYSALAARLFFHDKAEIPQSLAEQADKWYQIYHTQPTDTSENFIAKVIELEQTGCSTRGIDLVFVLDGSGSVTQAHFNTSKDFVLEMVDFFAVGPDETRVGVIQFARHPRTEFYLGSFTEKTMLKQAVQNISYLGGYTNTGDALDLMSSTAFLLENGARPVGRGFPRVAIVVTDGMSHDSVLLPAARAREMGIIIFAIGVTDNVRGYELNAIANTPNVTYVYHVSDFDAISNIASALEYFTCVQAIQFRNQTISGTVDDNQSQHIEIPIPNNSATMTLNATKGILIAYISFSTPNPSEASHDEKLVAEEGEDTVTIVLRPEDLNKTCTPESARKRRQADTQDGGEAGAIVGIVYVTIEGQQATNEFVLDVIDGDFGDPPTTATVAMATSSTSSGFVATTSSGFVAEATAYFLLTAASSVSLAAAYF